MPFFNKEMKTPLPLGSPSPQKKKDKKKDQISSKIKQKITLAPFFFQFCDVNNLETFPQKIIKFVEFMMEKKMPKISQFLVEILTQFYFTKNHWS
jgi:hypothetical protein